MILARRYEPGGSAAWTVSLSLSTSDNLAFAGAVRCDDTLGMLSIRADVHQPVRSSAQIGRDERDRRARRGVEVTDEHVVAAGHDFEAHLAAARRHQGAHPLDIPPRAAWPSR